MNKFLKKKTNIKIVLFSLIILFTLLGGSFILTKPNLTQPTMNFNEFMTLVSSNKVDSVIMNTDSFMMNVKLKNGNSELVINPNYREFIRELLDAGINVKFNNTIGPDTLITMYIYLLIFILILSILILSIISLYKFIKTHPFNFNEENNIIKSDVNLNNIIGLESIKEDLGYITTCLKGPASIKAFGIEPIKRLLIEGDYGTGKTLLSKAIAGEVNAKLLSYDGSDFLDKFSIQKLNNIFKTARFNKPCIILIDNLDALFLNIQNFSELKIFCFNLIKNLNELDENTLFIATIRNKMLLYDYLNINRDFDKIISIPNLEDNFQKDILIKSFLKNNSFEDNLKLEEIIKMLPNELSAGEIKLLINKSIEESIKSNDRELIKKEYIKKSLSNYLKTKI
ncbi:ATP-dependent metallopeptidase FtsH/Yme1/Tma family protein [Clostridioides difficile]|uniref:ATP-dependent metallopeptidase FtsH/Yme1/Tma family protein n=1 Tax=Clostridioides difficile TaxID=1496 RepID=UPI000D1EA6E3|nr:ATP-dependent metallopeptidase FtsH/Yme1/Tma family protein [Clostridioides difficile]HBE9444567.1 AAA family ATPase [Clostridioides difficile]